MSSHVFLGYGNTVGHCAAEKGHAECLNCFVQHRGDLTLVNERDETALQSGRRHGAPVKLQKAGELFTSTRGYSITVIAMVIYSLDLY